jgi:hypothetical protein
MKRNAQVTLDLARAVGLDDNAEQNNEADCSGYFRLGKGSWTRR